MRKKVFYILIFQLLTVNVTCQSLSSLVKESKSLVEKTELKLIFPYQDKSSLAFPKPTIKKVRNLNLLQIELKKLQSSQYKKDIGLVFKANINHNFRDAIDEETNTSIKTRVRAELEWNILKMGYVYNRVKSKRLQNDIEILKLESNQTQKELWRRQFRIDYNFVINKEALNFYKDFLSFENEYFDFLNKLYFQKLIKRERLIKVSNRISILKTQVKVISKENSILKDSVSKNYQKVKKLPLLVIKTDGFSLKNFKNKSSLKEENIQLQHHYLNNFNLSFYVNQNYTYSESTQRYFPSIGVRFKAPIRFNNRKKIIKTKIKILKAQEIDKSLGKFNQIITYLSEYNEKLKDLQNQYKSWLILKERIRILKILKQEIKSEKTGFLVLELMEEQFKVLENTLQLKRQLYKIITRFFELNSSDNIHTLFIPFQFKGTNTNTKYLLKWNSQYSIDFQIKFLKAKQIKEVILLTDDKNIIGKLKKANILFTIKEKVNTSSVEKLITEELRIIKKQQNESI